MSDGQLGIRGGEPFEVGGADLCLVWQPVDGSGSSLAPGPLRVDPVEFSFAPSPEFLQWFNEAVAGVPAAREQRAAVHRRAWSGPDRTERQILKAFRVRADQIGTAPRSVFSSEYRQRQRSRVKWPCRTVLLLAEGYGWTGEAK